jgi:hypothetical protein
MTFLRSRRWQSDWSSLNGIMNRLPNRSSGALPAAISTIGYKNWPSKTANNQPWRPDPENTLVNL